MTSMYVNIHNIRRRLKGPNHMTVLLWCFNTFLHLGKYCNFDVKIGEYSSLVILAVNANLLLPTAYFVCRNT